MKTQVITAAMLLFAWGSAIAQSAQSAAETSAPVDVGVRQPAYYQLISVSAAAAAGSFPMAIEVSSCVQYVAPEVNLIRCKLAVKFPTGLKSFAGRFDFTDRDGKTHASQFSSSNNSAWKTGDTVSHQLELSLGGYEAVSFRWTLEGYTDGHDKRFGKEPKQEANGPDAIDTVCVQRGYKKK